jgi:hypothetical protein
MAYNRIKHVKQVADAICEDRGYDEYHEFDAEDIEYLGMEVQCGYADVCEILGIELPESLGPVVVG